MILNVPIYDGYLAIVLRKVMKVSYCLQSQKLLTDGHFSFIMIIPWINDKHFTDYKS